MIERAIEDGRESRHSRFRNYPRGSLRKVRRDAAGGFHLLRLAVALQEADDDRDRELVADLQARAAQAGKARRRAQTLPAQQARLAKAAARKAGTVEPSTSG